MLGGKKVCPNCGQPQEKHWDKCPFCINMSGMAMGGSPGPAPGGFGVQNFGGPPQGYGGAPATGYGVAASAGAIAPQRTVALAAAPGASFGQQQLGWIVPLKGPHRGELHTLKPTSVIGKDPTCDVVFNDPFMSGRHATIRARPTGFVLEDHSTNGTFVNDKKIKTHELVDSDFIKLGQTLVKFKAL
jgi:FHA domain